MSLCNAAPPPARGQSSTWVKVPSTSLSAVVIWRCGRYKQRRAASGKSLFYITYLSCCKYWPLCTSVLSYIVFHCPFLRMQCSDLQSKLLQQGYRCFLCLIVYTRTVRDERIWTSDNNKRFGEKTLAHRLGWPFTVHTIIIYNMKSPAGLCQR